MSVVSLNDLVEKRGENIVSVVGSGVNTNSRIKVLASREDLLLDSVSEHILLVPYLIPNISSEVGGEGRLGSGGVSGEASDVGVSGGVFSNGNGGSGVLLQV
jgi:hypothetical protein